MWTRRDFLSRAGAVSAPRAAAVSARGTAAVPAALHQRKGDNRFSARSRRSLQFLKEGQFKIIRVRNHFTRGNFLVGSPMKTKFADSQPFLRTNGRPKRAARHRPRLIELTSSSFRIERGTGLIVGKFSETLFGDLPFVQHARRGIAREFPS